MVETLVKEKLKMLKGNLKEDFEGSDCVMIGQDKGKLFKMTTNKFSQISWKSSLSEMEDVNSEWSFHTMDDDKEIMGKPFVKKVI